RSGAPELLCLIPIRTGRIQARNRYQDNHTKRIQRQAQNVRPPEDDDTEPPRNPECRWPRAEELVRTKLRQPGEEMDPLRQTQNTVDDLFPEARRIERSHLRSDAIQRRSSGTKRRYRSTRILI